MVARKVVWHGTRSSGLLLARRAGFALRDPIAVAEVVAATCALSIDEILASPEYGDAVGSLSYVKDVLSATDDRRLAEEYARTGSGTVSDILAAAHRLLRESGQPQPNLGRFLADWLRTNEGPPTVIEIHVPTAKIVSVAAHEFGIPLAEASDWARWVWDEDGTRKPFR